jgi:hypothetical protein
MVSVSCKAKGSLFYEASKFKMRSGPGKLQPFENCLVSISPAKKAGALYRTGPAPQGLFTV